MKHATALTLERLAPLLAMIRGLSGLTEKKPGIFYRKGKAYLHFHEDPAGLFADAKLGTSAFTRFAVNSPSEWGVLMEQLRRP